MTISMNVLNHLGIGLYSNVPAVLSEIVANAWDADATEVQIDIDLRRDEITIKDNGCGMSKEDINNKYLTVGYSKRTVEPGKTIKGRDPMGRKGIGKLSVFSIADVIEVYSVKGRERNALMMNRQDIQEYIKGKAEGEYFPAPLNTDMIDFPNGTKIILRQLQKNINRAEEFLRKRLARRFSIIAAKNDFRVLINGAEITAKDRDYYDRLEYIWYMGDESQPILADCKNIEKAIKLDAVVDPEAIPPYKVKGWIGTVDEQKSLSDENNAIIIYAHGKLVQEDILKDFKEGGVYAQYLIGEIEADFLDLDDKDDIVTSDRQRLKEEDSRTDALKKFIRTVLKTIQNQWTNLRTEGGAKRALIQPVVKEWYGTLQGDNKTYARKLFGKIESLKIPDPIAKKEMYKTSILAFETMALKNALSVLDAVETDKDLELVTKIFAGIDALEAVHYYQIVKGRVEVVSEFKRILPDSREKILQKYIFEHLWLLDPSWERASSNLRIEEAVTTEFKDIDANLTDKEKAGRIDIRYKTAAGKHIIIELKKYDRSVTVYELLEQVNKYQNALEKCLTNKFPHETRVIESICILGIPPEPRNKEAQNIGLLREVNSRYITYDELIQRTLESYKDYLDKEREVSDLIALLDRFDEEFEV